MTNSPAQKRSNNNIPVKKNQNAAKVLNNYMNQLKIHFDLSDRDIVKVLEAALKERRGANFIKKWWHLLY